MDKLDIRTERSIDFVIRWIGGMFFDGWMEDGEGGRERLGGDGGVIIIIIIK